MEERFEAAAGATRSASDHETWGTEMPQQSGIVAGSRLRTWVSAWDPPRVATWSFSQQQPSSAWTSAGQQHPAEASAVRWRQHERAVQSGATSPVIRVTARSMRIITVVSLSMAGRSSGCRQYTTRSAP